MWIDQKKITVSVDATQLEPTLRFTLVVEDFRGDDAPLFFSAGQLICSGKTISPLFLDVSQLQSETKELRCMRQESERALNKHFYLCATLSRVAIDYIEKIRMSNSRKSIQFDLKIALYKVYGLQSKSSSQVGSLSDLGLKVDLEIISSNVIIEQSVWVNDFVQKLGIGKFILIEFNSEIEYPSEEFEKIHSTVKKSVSDQLSQLQQGNWEYAMLSSRKALETLRATLYDKTTKKILQNPIVDILKRDHFSEDAIESLAMSIGAIFDLVSKYAHTTDRKGNQIDSPIIPTKEDAYFVYTFTSGLLNMLTSKLNRSKAKI